MLADAALSLVALLNGPRQPLHTKGKQRLPHSAILTSLHVAITDDLSYSATNHDTCAVITPVVRAFGQLRCLRVLDLRFAGILCPFTAQHLTALGALADLRQLTVTYDAIVHWPATRPMCHPWQGCSHVGGTMGQAASAAPFGDDALLAFVAPRPGLRRLELLTPMAKRRDSRRRESGPFFLALLGESCPRFECLKLSMLCRLDSLVGGSSPATPAFPALRCLDIATPCKWYVLLSIGEKDDRYAFVARAERLRRKLPSKELRKLHRSIRSME